MSNLLAEKVKASAERKVLENGLKPLMKESGFKKAGPTWRKETEAAIQVLNIQGSQWSKTFYINLGVYFNTIGHKQQPNEYECHVRERLCALVEDSEQCNNLLRFENNDSHEERLGTLSELISKYAIKWLEKCSTRDGAKEYLLNEKKHGLPVLKETWEYLGINHS